MIQMQSVLEVADNSGAKKISSSMRSAGRRAATRGLGDIVIGLGEGSDCRTRTVKKGAGRARR